MPIEAWSDNIHVLDLQDDPSFTDELNALHEQMDSKKDVDIVLNFSGVSYLNSSNIAKLLRLRKSVLNNHRRLVLCQISTTVWGLFLVTGLDKVFDFADTVATGLTTLQLGVETEPQPESSDPASN